MDDLAKSLSNTGDGEKNDGAELHVICVDLDGTLLATDTLHECLFRLVRRRPSLLLKLPGWLLSGKAYFKAQVAKETVEYLGPLPYQDSVVSYLRERASLQDEIVLATAANQSIADQIAEECGFFSHVLASDETTNLSGEKKLAAIRNLIAERDFDYLGDCSADIPIWREARQAIVVGGSAALLQKASSKVPAKQLPSLQGSRPADWLKQLRVHQWSKNALLAVPLVLAHQYTSLQSTLICLVAILAFSFCASAVYIINDLLDLPDDRQHPTKRNRPIARGAISIKSAVIVALCLLLLSVALSLLATPPLFSLMLAGYFVSNLVYSFFLKNVPVLDIVTLAGFYTYRVLIGAVAIDVTISFWLLAFSLFFFLNLATIKRYADLIQTKKAGKTDQSGQSYTTEDIGFFQSIASATSCVSVLILMLYLQSNEALDNYSRPKVLWLVSPVIMFWIIRILLIATRGKMPDDPVLFAIRDRVSYYALGICGLLLLLAK